jgi:hypothetical protein
MSTDMRLVAASEEAAGSEESEPVAMGLGCPLDWRGLESPATIAAYAALPAATSSCRLVDDARLTGHQRHSLSNISAVHLSLHRVIKAQ